MKIALLTDGIYPYVIGGMQKHSFCLAKYFALNKIEVDLYHTFSAEMERDGYDLAIFSKEEKAYISAYAIPFPVLDKFPGHYIRESYAYSAAIFEKLTNNSRVDFIYVQGLCGMKLLEEKKGLNIPIGINFHGLEMFQPATNLRTKLEQYLFRSPVIKSMKNADIVFSLGGQLTKILGEKGISKNKIIQIPNGIDRSWIRSAPLSINAKRKFVFIGRYERRKGIEELTSVIKKINDKQSFSFDFIGNIPDKKRIPATNIHYHGSITDSQQIKNILSNADILICPSYSEGMPTVILEAMASGMAIIASKVGAVSEQVTEDNGALIKPGDTNELKKAIVRFVDMDDKKLMQMKVNSIKQINEHFLWEKIISKTIESIVTLIKS